MSLIVPGGLTAIPYLAPLLIAPFVGSFLGTLILRLPQDQPVVAGRSVCPHCGAKLAPRDLIPLVSWILTRGRCRHCHVSIGAFYPAVELAATAIAGTAVAVTGDVSSCWLVSILGWTLLCLSWIDIRDLILPDILTLPLILVGLAVSIPGGTSLMIGSGLGAVAGFAAFWLTARIYAALRGRQGLGEGDAKLLAAGGAWLTWQPLPWVIFMSSILALFAVITAMLLGYKIGRKTQVAFGPFLAASIWAAYTILHVSPAFGPDIYAITGLYPY